MKKLLKIKNIIEKKYKGDKKLDFLKKFGFEKVITHTSSGFIYRNKKMGVVVKIPYVLSSKKPPKKYLIETFIYKDVFIQPMAKVDKKSSNLAYKRLLKVANEKECWDDLCNLNVGLHRGRAVMFDW